jgi:hypothetical protein
MEYLIAEEGKADPLQPDRASGGLSSSPSPASHTHLLCDLGLVT